MAALLAVVTFLGILLHRVDRRSWGSLRRYGRLLSSDRLFGIGQPISDCNWVHRILVILNGIHDQDIFRSDLREQDRDVCSITNGSGRDRIQSVYEQSYPINKFARHCRSARQWFREAARIARKTW